MFWFMLKKIVWFWVVVFRVRLLVFDIWMRFCMGMFWIRLILLDRRVDMWVVFFWIGV